MKKLYSSSTAVSGALTIVSFFVYLFTLCPTVSFTDAGELAAVATTLGVAHPTGYPLFTLCGRLAVMIPVAAEEIVRLNTLAAILTALSVGAFFHTVVLLQETDAVFPSKRKNRTPLQRYISAGTASLVFAFSSTVWSQSTSIEVYSLHVLLILITTGVFVKGVVDQITRPHAISPYLFAFAYVVGLSFANHMTTILLAPAFLYLYAATLGLRKQSVLRLLKLIPVFLMGLSVYLYLPIRSGSRLLFDWGHPVTFERFFWHVSGKQYQVWMFEGWEVAKKQLAYFVNHFPSEFHYVIIAIMLLGVLRVFVISWRRAIFLSLLFFTCLVYSINYQIHDIDSYFLLAFVVVSIFVANGIDAIVERANTGMRSALPYGFLIVLPFVQIWSNYKNVDESENFLVEDTALNGLNGLKPNSVVFTSLWDYFVSPSYYFQKVRKVRPDVIIIDKALLQNRTWYFLQLERNHPWLIERSRDKINSFVAELEKFERGIPFNQAIIQATWADLLNDLVLKSLKDHEVYLDGRVEKQFPLQFERVPEGLFLRLVRPGEWMEFADFNQKWRNIARKTPVSEDFRQYFCFMMMKNAIWLNAQERRREAIKMLETALKVNEMYAPALALRKQLEQ
ncbi:MAG: DUF2723 domain-containing protein [Ignavibacteriales bacterium]|nr:DUF2723 domain-containing protein [Ignavibacteriales bacterium]